MEQLKSDYLFVYSSLREGFKSSEYEYVRKYFSFVNRAKVKGILSDLGNNPVATPTTEDCFIYGELYKIINSDEFSYAIGQLDDYEGVKPEADEVRLYKRELTEIYLEDESKVTGWIYWYKGDIGGKPVIESGDVLKYIHSKKR